MVPNGSKQRNWKAIADSLYRIVSDVIYWISLITLILTIAHSMWKQSETSKFIRLEDIRSMQRFYEDK